MLIKRNIWEQVYNNMGDLSDQELRELVTLALAVCHGKYVVDKTPFTGYHDYQHAMRTLCRFVEGMPLNKRVLLSISTARRRARPKLRCEISRLGIVPEGFNILDEENPQEKAKEIAAAYAAMTKEDKIKKRAAYAWS